MRQRSWWLPWKHSALGVGEDTRGVFVMKVPENSDAFRAGLRRGDFIERLNGQAVGNLKAFQTAVGRLAARQKVEFDVIRDQHRVAVKPAGSHDSKP